MFAVDAAVALIFDDGLMFCSNVASNTYFGDGTTDPWSASAQFAVLSLLCCVALRVVQCVVLLCDDMCCRHALAVLPTGDKVGVEYLVSPRACLFLTVRSRVVCCVFFASQQHNTTQHTTKTGS